MAIQKLYHVVCEGPCKQQTTVDKIPPLWSRLKVDPAVQIIGRPQEYLVSTLCPSCTMKAVALLRDAGFKLTSVNGQKKEGPRGRTADWS